jgi:uncharacterized protein with gpF-like domain
MNDATWRKLPPGEAISYFRQKINLPSTTWQDIWREANNWAFQVAGVTKAQLLNDLRESVDKSIADGTTLEEFRQNFDSIAAKHGWAYNGNRNWRSAVILETNIQTAYAAGRYRQMTQPEVLSARPYWQWRHGGSIEPRPLHQEWDGLILRASDPWWETHYPPCGFGCKCKVFSFSERELQGREPDTAPNNGTYQWTDSRGNTHTLPNGVDPGWNYAPGASLPQQRQQILRNTLSQLPEALRRQVEDDINSDQG